MVAVTVRVRVRARDFWCWNDLEWTGCGRVTGHRTDDNVFFGARSRSDAGSRRWRQKGCSSPLARSWPAREDSSTRELASPKLVSATAPTQQCDWRCELAINESKKMAALARREQLAALARSEHERAARSLPATALPQRAFSENTTKRDIPTFVRARIREFEAARECVVILAACLGVLFFESRRWRSARWRGE